MTLPVDPHDPYTGTHYAERVPVPALEPMVLQEAWSEPAELTTIDPGTGFTVSRQAHPVYRCFWCGTETTRRVPEAAEYWGEGLQMHWGAIYRAECPQCAAG